jgi:hypothetical protein
MTPFNRYDRTHLANVQHYKDFVFTKRDVIRKGDFIEDTYFSIYFINRFGHYMVRQLRLAETEQEKIEMHAKFGCFLYRPVKNLVYLQHLNGRKYLTHDQKQVYEVKKCLKHPNAIDDLEFQEGEMMSLFLEY